jgi:hypothetical protein
MQIRSRRELREERAPTRARARRRGGAKVDRQMCDVRKEDPEAIAPDRKRDPLDGSAGFRKRSVARARPSSTAGSQTELLQLSSTIAMRTSRTLSSFAAPYRTGTTSPRTHCGSRQSDSPTASSKRAAPGDASSMGVTESIVWRCRRCRRMERDRALAWRATTPQEQRVSARSRPGRRRGPGPPRPHEPPPQSRRTIRLRSATDPQGCRKVRTRWSLRDPARPKSSMFSLPTIRPPAARMRSTTTASCDGVNASMREPFVIPRPRADVVLTIPR